VLVTQDGEYEVTVQSRPEMPAGDVYFRLDELEVRQTVESGQEVCTFTGLHLPKGRGRIEAWRQTNEPFAPAYFKRFIPALYVNINSTT
jgi:hypothetical protein